MQDDDFQERHLQSRIASCRDHFVVLFGSSVCDPSGESIRAVAL